ncbi:hypothetical protein GW574_21590 (plasmid) [Pantoea agglomerans]|uniref:hypothetical protein n=1 Tax=Enterobacter agglomerans TaxID=549 RepID=UPI00139915AC|nr:hypothetical protein [Pantoea agglomerans]QIA54940.1 hypothetical protein GW574_21590 [Pantoea agglomerans]
MTLIILADGSRKEYKALFQAEVIHRKSGQPVCKPVRIIASAGIHSVHPADLIDLFLLPYHLRRFCHDKQSTSAIMSELLRPAVNPALALSELQQEN